MDERLLHIGKCVEDGPNYTCECDSGYKFNGKTCQDVDECQELPCGNGDCSNSPGSYRSANKLHLLVKTLRVSTLQL